MVKEDKLLSDYVKYFGEKLPLPPRHIMESLVKMKEEGNFDDVMGKILPEMDSIKERIKDALGTDIKADSPIFDKEISENMKYSHVINYKSKEEFDRILSIHLSNGWKTEGDIKRSFDGIFSQEISIVIQNYHYVSFYEDGSIEELGNYDKNTINENYIEKYDDGKIMLQETDGKLLGKYYKYYPNGNIKEESEFLSKYTYRNSFRMLSGIECGREYNKYNEVLINSWNSNGKIMVKEGSGEHLEYNEENGALIFRTSYLNYMLHGESIAFSENGQLEYKCYYKKDKLHGSQVHYYLWSVARDAKVLKNKSILIKEGEYEEGRLIGKLKTYHRDGSIECEFIEKNDILYLLNNWDINGDLMVENGHGIRKMYWLPDEELDRGLSVLESTGPYKDGLKHGRWYEYCIEGIEIVTEGEYVKGEEEGEWVYYKSDGVINKKINYSKGKEQ